MSAGASLRPLRHRNFALVWWAALVSNIGTWMQTIAVGALVTEVTHRSSAPGAVAAAGFLPIGVLSPLGGALADRLERRRLLLLTTVGETFFATLLAVLYATGHATTLAVGACVFGAGCAAAADHRQPGLGQLGEMVVPVSPGAVRTIGDRLRSLR